MTDMIRVRAVTSFDNVRVGDEATVELNDRIRGIIARGYLTVVGEPDGEVRIGPRRRRKSVGKRGEVGVGDGISAGSEPSEAPDSGGHGPTEVLDSV